MSRVHSDDIYILIERQKAAFNAVAKAVNLIIDTKSFRTKAQTTQAPQVNRNANSTAEQENGLRHCYLTKAYRHSFTNIFKTLT